MRLLSFILFLFFAGVSFAEEKTVQVGKHVIPSTNATTMILSLLIVLMVVVASAYLLKKFQMTTQKSNQNLKVVSSLHVGTKERVIVVQVAEKQLVLGVTANQITLLDTLDNVLDESSVATKSTSEPFDKSIVSMLKNSIKKND